MSPDMWIVIGVIVATFAAIASHKLRPELAALGAFCVLVLAGVLAPSEVFPVFGSEAIVTVGAMFVLSAALERTGVIDSATRLLRRLPIRNETMMLLVLLPPVLALSAFMNNTPVVIVFLPIIITVARQRGLAASKLLIPMSFVSILGGSATLIGTSTNLVASTAGQRLGLAPIGMFEMTSVGLVLAAAGLLFLLFIAPRLLPRRETVTSIMDEGTRRQFLTEAFVPVGSRLIGKVAREALARALQDGRLLELIRHGEVLAENPGSLRLEAGDRLRISVDATSVNAVKRRAGLQFHAADAADLAVGDTEETSIVECVVSPRSTLVGHTLAEADFPRRFGIIVLAVHRNGVNLQGQIGATELESGDMLLVEASEAALRQLRGGGDLLVLAGGHRAPRLSKRWLAAGLILAVVTLSGWQLVPVSVAALAAAVFAVAFRCIDAEDAYRAVDWPTLFLIAGMLAIGVALEKTRTAELMAQVLVENIAPLGPWVTLSLVIFAASALTNVLSNNAVAALLVPLAVQTAQLLAVDPRPFLMAVAFGASACFATPIGYQTNTLVFSAGGYRFADFIRVGLPLNVMHWILASFLIPLVWPLH